jgi:hypothetical protein
MLEPNLSSLAKESRSNRLVKDLEEFRGCTLRIAGRRAGFNGLSVYDDDVVRKIEIKTVDRSDNWFAINGLYGIEKLFFDPQYYLYFVLITQEKILIAHAIPFLQAQIPTYNADIGRDVSGWLDLTKALGTKSGLNIIPRINFKLRVGIRELVRLLESGQGVSDWYGCVDSIWCREKPGSWYKTFSPTAYPPLRADQAREGE